MTGFLLGVIFFMIGLNAFAPLYILNKLSLKIQKLKMEIERLEKRINNND